jgi:hypothetical protein
MMWRSRRAVRLAGALAAALLTVALGGVGGPAAGPARAATTACKFRAGAQPPGTNAELESVTVLSPCNAWAAGEMLGYTALTEHWDGSKWTIVPSGVSAKVSSRLNSVSAASPDSVWAGGWIDAGTSTPSTSLILHWDGNRWTRQDTPAIYPSSRVDGVAAVSDGEAWAIGNDGLGQGIILHLTGGRWRQVPIPVTVPATLNGVTAVSASDVWAVGATYQAGTTDTLILHWNGHAWTRQDSSNPGDADMLLGVDASSRSSAMAVGSVRLANGRVETLVLRMGPHTKAWTRVPSPNPADTVHGAELTSVAVISPRSARAVGFANTTGSTGPLIEQWDGTRWSMAKAPDADHVLDSIAASSPSNQWAVGARSVGGVLRPFALHFG